jgi:hypothetical protein
VPFARQALRVLFDGGRAVFTPQESGQTGELVATCTLDRLFTGIALPQTVVTPAGFAGVSSVELRGTIRVA